MEIAASPALRNTALIINRSIITILPPIMILVYIYPDSTMSGVAPIKRRKSLLNTAPVIPITTAIIIPTRIA